MARKSKAAKRPAPRKRRPQRKSGRPARKAPPPGAPVAAPPATAGKAAGGGVRVRLFCQGIGDCHLLRFDRDGGAFWMLIDCGVHSSVSGGADTVRKIVDNILSVTRRLDVIVLTHEHWDHNSGFLSAREKFQQFEVGEIWLAWTENGADPQARELDKFKDDALKALQGASQRLDRVQGLSPYLANVREGLGAVLGFNFGAQGEKVRSARNAAVSLAPNNIKYLEPKTAPFLLSVDPPVRVYVLGPPRDKGMLSVTDSASEMYGLATTALAPVVNGLNNSFEVTEGSDDFWNDETAPFDPNEGFVLSDLLNGATAPVGKPDATDAAAHAATVKLVKDLYAGDESTNAWRRIDHDWLGVSADLAIQLDKKTNNSSLVLAFEFVETSRVMLFVGDAQVGNWLSWKDVQWKIGDKTVSAYDLLARTVFYKVGHHGSHNATLKQHGLELMTSPDLSAFIPTNEVDAKNVGWGEMPFEPLLDDLEKRTAQRVVRADDPWLKQPAGQPGFVTPAGAATGWGAIKAVDHDKSGDGLWVEFLIA
ncbi:MAG TPA: MBL fold metallo-hydrolase [Bradyrhizobium sp.]|nr:MBL fold metallo-hydrolase [Bradyrhizobium sp.]